MRTSPKSMLFAAAAVSVVVAAPRAADACGGFFCNNLAPVVQSGESILFSVNEGVVEAHVQVLYEGPSESFAWIVPTPSRPTVGVSHARVFSALQAPLRIRPSITTTVEGSCYQYPSCPSDDEGDWLGADAGGATADSASDAAPSPDGVTIIEQNNVGPYDYVILQAESTAPLFEWLEANAYEIPPTVGPFIEPYILMDDDVHFVAIRLSKNRETGDIVPVVLTYDADEPMIPIQLTAVASTDALPIHVYLLGEHRAVPENYVHAIANPAFGSPGWAGFGELAIAPLVEAAGGHAFITHYAGTTSIVGGTVFAESMTPPVFGDDWGLDSVISELSSWLSRTGLGLDPTVLGVLDEHIDLGAMALESGIDMTQALGCPFCFNFSDGSFDAAGLNEDLELIVLAPLRHVQGLIDEAQTITYLATVMEPENMDRDPYFTFNPDLPDVSNIVSANAAMICGRGRAPWLAPWRIDMEGGPTIWSDSTSLAVAGVSPVLRTEELGAAGPAMTVSSFADETAALIETHNARLRAERDFDPTEPPGPVSCDDDGDDWVAPSDGISTEPGRPVAYPRAPGQWRFDEELGWVRIDNLSEERGCVAASASAPTGGLLAGLFGLLLAVGVYRRRLSSNGSQL